MTPRSSDDEAADDDSRQLFMSLVGALAWLILTMPSICVYVAFLQRQAKAPTIGHSRMTNRLLAWVVKNLERLTVWCGRLDGPPATDRAFRLRPQGARYAWARDERLRYIVGFSWRTERG